MSHTFKELDYASIVYIWGILFLKVFKGGLEVAPGSEEMMLTKQRKVNLLQGGGEGGV